MKTLYISENTLRQLKESVLMDAFPADIMQDIENDKTTFGSNPYFMGKGGTGMGKAFFMKAAKSQFNDAETMLKSFGQIDSVDAKTIEEAFQKIVTRCQKIEMNNKDALEKLAVNYVINLFSVPDDMVKIEAELVQQIENGDKISPVEPFDGDIDFELADLGDVAGLDGEIYKRQFLNALNMGAGMRMSENVRGYLDDLYDIDSRLPQLYKEAIALNNYMIFKKSDLGITDKNRQQIGLVNVKYYGQDELVTIDAKGVIFPVLLCELIRGFMELFSAHGLPKEKDRMDYVIKKTDFLKAEPWQMRIGPYMWNKFTSLFEDTDTDEMPYIYQTISKLKPEVFFDVMSEMLSNTAKGKRYAEKIKEMAVKDKEMAAFTDKMNTRQTDKTIITDGYLGPDEF